MGPRDILNKLKYHPELDLEEAEITIIHRGAPRDRLTFEGKNILDLGSGFMDVKGKDSEIKIPYHRITKIEKSDEIVWERNR